MIGNFKDPTVGSVSDSKSRKRTGSRPDSVGWLDRTRSDRIRYRIGGPGSAMIMPKLRRCALDCCLETNTHIERVFNSSLFNNDHRHVLIRFVFIKISKVKDNLLLNNDLSTEQMARYQITYEQGVSILFDFHI
jgi:hypothetical protein